MSVFVWTNLYPTSSIYYLIHHCTESFIIYHILSSLHCAGVSSLEVKYGRFRNAYEVSWQRHRSNAINITALTFALMHVPGIILDKRKDIKTPTHRLSELRVTLLVLKKSPPSFDITN